MWQFSAISCVSSITVIKCKPSESVNIKQTNQPFNIPVTVYYAVQSRQDLHTT